jgi:predicted nucleic acid-binding protein
LIVAIDTSVIVAALSTFDTRYQSAARAIERLANENTLIVPLHVLMECYSVLTRRPKPFRVSPAEALRALRESFGDMALAGLSTDQLWPLFESFVRRGISGGRIYDAAIAHAAREAGADAILTFNVRHFEGEGLQVLSP